LFATKNPLGHMKMKTAMWSVDSEGDYRFSDKTNPDQEVIFHQDHTNPLCVVIMGKFSNSKKRVQEVLDFVCNETPYLPKHLTEALRYAETRNLVQVDEVKLDGSKRRKGTFPEDAVITFS
jgi:hypothetical protein